MVATNDFEVVVSHILGFNKNFLEMHIKMQIFAQFSEILIQYIFRVGSWIYRTSKSSLPHKAMRKPVKFFRILKISQHLASIQGTFIQEKWPNLGKNGKHYGIFNLPSF